MNESFFINYFSYFNFDCGGVNWGSFFNFIGAESFSLYSNSKSSKKISIFSYFTPFFWCYKIIYQSTNMSKFFQLFNLLFFSCCKIYFIFNNLKINSFLFKYNLFYFSNLIFFLLYKIGCMYCYNCWMIFKFLLCYVSWLTCGCSNNFLWGKISFNYIKKSNYNYSFKFIKIYFMSSIYLNNVFNISFKIMLNIFKFSWNQSNPIWFCWSWEWISIWIYYWMEKSGICINFFSWMLKNFIYKFIICFIMYSWMLNNCYILFKISFNFFFIYLSSGYITSMSLWYVNMFSLKNLFTYFFKFFIILFIIKINFIM
uniref:NADH dehydrogenase subunit 1 n=1 Tax=Helcystogramma macroscopa TaxID=1604231 RepID=A0A342CJ37_9NEOP|nr:NADH dehydrogenase subunit 1 [Helcystogramma macroscopa]